jgi:DNA helicase-2/ATP-dependent DNA helicase PcrA
MAITVEDGDDLALPHGLTPAQREAVEAPDPLLCVLAGAGAGKTRVLTLRVARRVVRGEVSAERVLVCTFSRKAADELRRRLWSLDIGEGIRAGTFHRTALGLLRQHRADRHLAPPTVLADRRDLLAAVAAPGAGGTGRGVARRPRGEAGARPAVLAQLDAEIGWAKARLVRPADYPAQARAHGRRVALGVERVAELFQRYEEARRRQRALDFDDLLTTCADVLAQDVAFADAVRWRFRHLFVDEMQDVNPAQFRLLMSLLGDEPDLMVVGDPNQSVYGFNGADPTLIDRLPTVLPGTRVIRLDENHRCSPQVVGAASAALGIGSPAAGAAGPGTAGPTSSRPDGAIPRVTEHETDAVEAQWLAREVWLAHRPGRRWSQIAVLARTNAQLDLVAIALQRAAIPSARAGTDLGPASDVRAGPDRHDEAGGGGPDEDRARRGPSEWRDPMSDAVVLTTFHRAKGLQWPAVFVIGLADGLVPLASARDRAARDEERRLLYVAMTRAEDELTCSWARRRGDQATGPPAAREPSPWLEAVVRATDELRARAAPLDPASAATRVAELRARVAGPRPEPGTAPSNPP